MTFLAGTAFSRGASAQNRGAPIRRALVRPLFAWSVLKNGLEIAFSRGASRKSGSLAGSMPGVLAWSVSKKWFCGRVASGVVMAISAGNRVLAWSVCPKRPRGRSARLHFLAMSWRKSRSRVERLHKMALRQICLSTSHGICVYGPSVSLLNDRVVRVGVLRSKHEAEKPPDGA